MKKELNDKELENVVGGLASESIGPIQAYCPNCKKWQSCEVLEVVNGKYNVKCTKCDHEFIANR